VFAGVAACAGGQQYSLQDTGLTTCVTDQPVAINASGQVAGTCCFIDPYDPHGFLWSNGQYTDLGPGQANGINDAGVVVGQACFDTSIVAFSYSAGQTTYLGTLGGTASNATAINASGEIVGWALASQDANAAHPCAFLAGAVTDIGLLPGNSSGFATSVNASGDVVGYDEDASYVWSGFLYSGGSLTALPPLGDMKLMPSAINGSGQIVGRAIAAADDVYCKAFLYANGTATDLGSLYGQQAWAWGLNDWGWTVGGTCHSPANNVGFLYMNGQMMELNALLDTSGSSWIIEDAMGINDCGQIAAEAFNWQRGQSRYVVLTPNGGVSGSVALQGYSGDVTQVPVTVEIRNPGSTTVLQRTTVRLQSDGSFSLPSPLVGTYDVSFKASHWLRRTIAGVTLTASSRVSLGPSLINGDVNGDNAINLSDLIAISAAWRSTQGSANWNPNADLNGDGNVNLADWMIVASNWRKSGDP
jgi:probable HAF family extracellular repeat protein